MSLDARLTALAVEGVSSGQLRDDSQPAMMVSPIRATSQ